MKSTRSLANHRSPIIAAGWLLVAGWGVGSDLTAQSREFNKAPASDPKLVYTALSPLLEYQRRFFERRMIDPAFLARFNDLVRIGDFTAAASLVAQSIGVSGAVVSVGPAPRGAVEGPGDRHAAMVCFGNGTLKTCAEWA